MTWAEFKQKVEALGVLDDTELAFIDVDAVGRREDDTHELRVIAAPTGAGIIDDRSERRPLPGPGAPLHL